MTRTQYGPDGRYAGEVVIGFDVVGMTAIERETAWAEALRMLSSTTRGRIIEMLSMLFAATKSRPGAEVDRAAMLTVYANELRDCPEIGINEACRNLARTQTFFPSLAEILAAVELWEAKTRLAMKALEPKPEALPKQHAGGFRVASQGSKFSVLRDMGQEAYDKKVLEIRAALARGENIALWLGQSFDSGRARGREDAA